MKFVVAVVMLALAVGVQSSLWGGPAISYVSQSIHPGWPYGSPQPPAVVAIQAPAPWGVWGGAPSLYGGYPGISLSQGPAKLAAPIALGHEGVYVAKTRGAIHTAPLAGHINSATSLNLAPAPGTH